MENEKIIKIHSIHGSYITDPIKYINTVTVNCDYIIIGGDCGGGTTKLGITYQNKKNKIDDIKFIFLFM